LKDTAIIWDINNKIAAVVTDNASNIVGAVMKKQLETCPMLCSCS